MHYRVEIPRRQQECVGVVKACHGPPLDACAPAMVLKKEAVSWASTGVIAETTQHDMKRNVSTHDRAGEACGSHTEQPRTKSCEVPDSAHCDTGIISGYIYKGQLYWLTCVSGGTGMNSPRELK